MSVINGENLHDCPKLEYDELKEILGEKEKKFRDFTHEVKYLIKGDVFGKTHIKENGWFHIQTTLGGSYTWLFKIKICPFCDEILRRSSKSTSKDL